jgi:hypothetical protein
MNGAKNWVFCDGDLPPTGSDPKFEGHEALMITNVSDKDARILIDVLFEDKNPVENIKVNLMSKRVVCIRLDKPFGDQNYRIPKGQYALHLKSDVPVCAVFGRCDVRQNNLSYYSVNGISF